MHFKQLWRGVQYVAIIIDDMRTHMCGTCHCVKVLLIGTRRRCAGMYLQEEESVVVARGGYM